ncbi:cytochrome c oxidase assembly protein [bacterium]|nr:cytochrome c oxidase assembly protein [bacterium]
MKAKALLLACVVVGALAPAALAAPREVNVHFRGTVDKGLPLDFGPTRPALRVKLGEKRTIPYRLTNFTKEPMHLKAVLKVEPAEATKAFRVVKGLSLSPVLVQPGESKVLPVEFVVAPDLPTSAPELTVGFVLSKGAK